MQSGPGCKNIGRTGDHAYGYKLIWVIVDFGHDQWVDNLCTNSTHEHRVAIGRSCGKRLGANGAARSGAVLDDNSLPQLFGHLQIGRASWRERVWQYVEHAVVAVP